MSDPRLRWWHAGAVVVLLLFFLPVLLAPWWELARTPSAWSAWREWPRLVELSFNSLLLMLLTAGMTLPFGLFLAFMLVRTAMFGRRMFMLFCFLTLFVPLPLVTNGWWMFWQQTGWPIAQSWWLRLLAAAAQHSLVALPGLVLIVGLGWRALEPELEEEALLAARPWRVFWHVIWPRLRPVVGLALGWAVLGAWNEITVTDMLQVRTFAEEVYTQFMTGEAELARAVAVTLPSSLLLAGLTWWAIQRWRRLSPPRMTWSRTRLVYPLRGGRGWLSLLAWLGMVIPWAIPLGSLIFQAGMIYHADRPPTFEPLSVLQRMGEQAARQGQGLFSSLLWAMTTGLLCAGWGLLLAWLMRHGRRLENALWVMTALIAATPGPILGLGLQTVILGLIQVPGGTLLRPLLYDGPSPAPNLWIGWMRFFPVAMAGLWWLARTVPAAWEESAWVDGASPWQRFKLAYLWPLLSSWLAVALAVGTLALGEISAGKIVSTPGYMPLSHLIFQQMHASADTELASLCLVLLVIVSGAAGLALWLVRFRRSGG